MVEKGVCTSWYFSMLLDVASCMVWLTFTSKRGEQVIVCCQRYWMRKFWMADNIVNIYETIAVDLNYLSNPHIQLFFNVLKSAIKPQKIEDAPNQW